jgi:hypothetical protein
MDAVALPPPPTIRDAPPAEGQALMLAMLAQVVALQTEVAARQAQRRVLRMRPGQDPSDSRCPRHVAELLPLAVLRREGGVGSDGDAAGRIGERRLTVGAACRRRGRQPPDVLVAAGVAAVRGAPAPSPLPAPQAS